MDIGSPKIIGSAIFFWVAAANVSFPQTLTTLASFDAKSGSYPTGNLIQGQDGNFYGMTTAGGHDNSGTIFKVTPAGTLTVLYAFCADANCTDGASPSGVLQGADGNFYGTAAAGGGHAQGSVFKVNPAGALTTLYSFCSLTACRDGATPNGLVLAMDGNFYGTTYEGGANNFGTVFKITPSGTLTTLHDFCSLSDCSDGGNPATSLIQGADGTLYGTTSTIYSLNYPCVGVVCNDGTVFKITPAGTLTNLVAFCPDGEPDCSEGSYPNQLVQATNGILYGFNSAGNFSFNSSYFYAVSPLTSAGDSSSPVLPDGDVVLAGLLQGEDGYLYGTTATGGTITGGLSQGGGSIFKITLKGVVTTLYSFCAQSNCPDGASPESTLIQGSDGNFYGTTYYGGAADVGTVFRLTTALPAIRITSEGTQTVIGAGATTKTLPIVFTLAGRHPLTLATASSNTALVPNSGIVVSNGCGTVTLVCRATLDIAADQIGSGTLTFTVTDSAGISDTASASVTVSKPAAPSVTIDGGRSQTISEGGSPTPISFTLTGTQALGVTVTSSNTTLLPQSGVTLSSGCGTRSLICTATLSVAPDQSGASVIAITTTDPYSQSATAAGSVTVNVPPHGGGAIDPFSVLGLISVLLIREGWPKRKTEEPAGRLRHRLQRVGRPDNFFDTVTADPGVCASR